MTKPYQQFRNKAEAQQAIEDMERRAETRDSAASLFTRRGATVVSSEHAKAASDYRAEAARIRALYNTLPDQP